jgi:hypothetical protein
LAIEEKNKLNGNLRKEDDLNENNIEEKNNLYMRKSLKDNNAFYFSNNSSSDLTEKNDSKGIFFL